MRGLLAVVFILAACSDDAVDAGAIDAGQPDGSGLAAAPIGGGYCCPIDMMTCNAYHIGGWAAHDDLDECLQIWDYGGGPIRIDEHGCQYVESSGGCGPADASPPDAHPIDAHAIDAPIDAG
jgi:hypothetical protein